MFNDALRKIAIPIPDEAAGHDWWLALLAAALGTIHYLDRPLIRHRRHATNASYSGRRTRWRDIPFIRRKQSPVRRRLLRRLHQSLALEERLAKAAPDAAATARLRRRVNTAFAFRAFAERCSSTGNCSPADDSMTRSGMTEYPKNQIPK